MAIIETLAGHTRDKQQSLFGLFGDPQPNPAGNVIADYAASRIFRQTTERAVSAVVRRLMMGCARPSSVM
jgi:hypothetical protein